MDEQDGGDCFEESCWEAEAISRPEVTWKELPGSRLEQVKCPLPPGRWKRSCGNCLVPCCHRTDTMWGEAP